MGTHKAIHVDGRQMVEPNTVDEWRAWLKANHESSLGVWLVTWKKHTGNATFTYDDAVRQALCFGWVDSRPAKLDDQRSMLYYSPRKPNSAWAATNKRRVAELEEQGLLAPAGVKSIEIAKQNGAWDKLNDSDALFVPEDLAVEFAKHKNSERNWLAFPPSVRKAHLEWIAQAKRPETRQTRLSTIAADAANNLRANQWTPKKTS